MPGAINLPLGTLRKRMAEVPQGKKLYVYCQVCGGVLVCACIVGGVGWGWGPCDGGGRCLHERLRSAGIML